MMTETSITVSPSEGAPHVKTDPGQGQSSLGGVSLNLDYFKTVPGILKLLQAVSTSSHPFDMFRCPPVKHHPLFSTPRKVNSSAKNSDRI